MGTTLNYLLASITPGFRKLSPGEHPLREVLEILREIDMELALSLLHEIRGSSDDLRSSRSVFFSPDGACLMEDMTAFELTAAEKASFIEAIIRSVYALSCLSEEQLGRFGDTVCDFGSGVGYNAALLAATGRKVVAVDRQFFPYTWHPVVRPEEIQEWDFHTLLLSWPLPNPKFEDVLERHRLNGGRRIIYVGPNFIEGSGQTDAFGTPMFFAKLLRHWQRALPPEPPLFQSGAREVVMVFDRKE
jgi:hypothetical protein